MWILDLALIELNAVSMMTSSKQQDVFALFQEINHQIQCNLNYDQKQLSSSKSNLFVNNNNNDDDDNNNIDSANMIFILLYYTVRTVFK